MKTFKIICSYNEEEPYTVDAKILDEFKFNGYRIVINNAHFLNGFRENLYSATEYTTGKKIGEVTGSIKSAKKQAIDILKEKGIDRFKECVDKSDKINEEVK